MLNCSAQLRMAYYRKSYTHITNRNLRVNKLSHVVPKNGQVWKVMLSTQIPCDYFGVCQHSDSQGCFIASTLYPVMLTLHYKPSSYIRASKHWPRHLDSSKETIFLSISARMLFRKGLTLFNVNSNKRLLSMLRFSLVHGCVCASHN